MIDKELLKQKQFIWDKIKDEEKSNSKIFNELCSFGIKIGGADTVPLRQDEIQNGILPLKSRSELHIMISSINEYSRSNGHDKINYDLFNEHNNNVYLTQLLTFAHENNARFQNEMYLYFINQTRDDNYDYCKFASAPVKTYDRCLIKCNTDYNNLLYPCGSLLLDIIRCSVTYNNIEGLLNGLNKFILDVNNGKIKCISRILRIKNGFSGIINDWKNIKDANYCDIKLNCIYENDTKTESQIVEIQFLVKFLLKAKKLGHKYYAIKRKRLFIDSINNIVYNIDNNYIKYKNKICLMIRNNNINDFMYEILIKPSIVISMFNSDAKTSHGCDLLLLIHIGYAISTKMKLLFLNCLFHYGEVILGETLEKEDSKDSKDSNVSKDDKITTTTTKTFIEKYLNFDNCRNPVFGEYGDHIVKCIICIIYV